MANYKEYRIGVDNNIVNLQQVETTKQSETVASSSQPKAPEHIGKLIAVEAGRKAFNYAVQNYGKLTGDDLGKQQIGDVVNIAGMIGLAAASPIGAFAVGVKVTTSLIDRAIDVSQSRRTSKAMQSRLGVSRGGSRYGANN